MNLHPSLDVFFGKIDDSIQIKSLKLINLFIVLTYLTYLTYLNLIKM